MMFNFISSEYVIYFHNITNGIYVSLILFFLGSSVASFFDATAFRMSKLQEGDVIFRRLCARSRCESCGSYINILALLPVFGWLYYRGKASCCGNKIPIKYPIHEFLMGMLFVVAPLFDGGITYYSIYLFFLLTITYAVISIDGQLGIIPEEITWTLLFTGLIFSPFSDLSDKVFTASLAGLLMWCLFFVIGNLKNQQIYAGGDVAFMFGVGAWLGSDLMPSYLIVFGILFLTMHFFLKDRYKDEGMPMGPALSIALCLVAVYDMYFYNLML